MKTWLGSDCDIYVTERHRHRFEAALSQRLNLSLLSSIGMEGGFAPEIPYEKVSTFAGISRYFAPATGRRIDIVYTRGPVRAAFLLDYSPWLTSTILARIRDLQFPYDFSHELV